MKHLGPITIFRDGCSLYLGDLVISVYTRPAVLAGLDIQALDRPRVFNLRRCFPRSPLQAALEFGGPYACRSAQNEKEQR